MTAVPVVLSPEPFSRSVEYMEAPAGQTVRAMLLEAVSAEKIALDALSRAVLYVDGVAIPRDEALDRVLVDGETVNIVVEPMGGGGGGGKNVGQTLLSIAVIAVSAWVGNPSGPMWAMGEFGRSAWATAVLVGGSAAVQALFRPGQQAQADATDRYALQGASNQYRQWQPFPLALGEVIAAPDFVAKTFTQNEGDEQWIYGILGLHYGPCEVSEERIGDTLISSMGSQDVRIVRHLTPGPRTFSLYPNDVEQLDLSEKFEEGVEIVRVAPQEGQRFDIDFYFPGGLHWRDDKGRYNVEQNDIDVSWRPVDEDGEATGGWSANTRWSFRSSTYDPLRLTRSISLPLGRYEFRLKKLIKPADQDNKRVDDMYWTAIKAVAFRKPLTDETLSIIEFAVRATAITQGTLATITCRIKPIMETWNGSTWGAPQPTSNPAAIARWLLTGPAPAKPMLPIQADARLRAWSQLCDQYGWTSNVYLTDDRKQDAVLALLEQSGRASLFWDGTQVAASPWVEKPAPRQMFAGDNLRDHSWQIVYPDEVHALRIEFQNIERRGEPDELYVYADGYAEQADASKGVQAANLVEAMRLEGQRTMAQAYKDGRWALGMRLHQRRVDTWSTGFDNLACSYGDRVRLAWSRVDGGDSMRVRCRRWAGALVSGLRLTQPVEMVAGVDYAVDMRLKSGVVTNVPVVTTPGVTREVQFQTPRGADFTAAADDLVVFGVPGRITEDVEVIGIEPGEELTARITGMRYVAPLLMAGETGPIPPLQTRLTGDRQKNPPQPTLLGVQVSTDGVRVGFSMPPWKGSPISGFAVRWRTAPEAGETVSWAPLPGLPANAMTLTTPPLREAPRALSGAETTRVQIEILAVTADGRTSPALIVTAQEDVVPTPLPGDWTITPFSIAPDGSRQLGFDVEGRVGADQIKRVLIEWGPSANGPWKAAYDGPPVEGLVRTTITVDAPGQYWFPISHWSAQGVPGGRLVYGPDTVEGQIAGDVSPHAPALVAMNKAIDAAAEGVEALDAAVGSLNATIYTAGTGLQARTDTLLATLNTPATGVLARLTATETKQSSDNAASVGRLNALEATVNTAGTGLLARMAAQESASTSLATGKADASRVQALEATVNTSGTGLSARLSSAETAVSELQTGKANAARVSALEAAVADLGAIQGIETLDATASAFTISAAGSSSAAAPVPASQIQTSNGYVFVPSLSSDAIYQRQTVRKRSGIIYEVEVEIDQAVAPSKARLRVSVLDGSLNALTPVSGPTVNLPVGSSILRTRFGSPQPLGGVNIPNGEWLRFGAQANPFLDGGTNQNGVTRLRRLKVTDVTGLAALEARATTLETATSNLQTGKADATRAAALEATVNTAGTGLLARTGALETATSDLQSKKADATRVSSLEATVNASGTGLVAKVGALETATSNLQTGKADASRVSSLEATINTAGTGVTARLTNVESVAAAADGRAKAIRGVVLDVNGYVSGYASTNDGQAASFEILADAFGIRAPGSGERTEYRAGNWHVYSPSENTRTRYGKAFGATQKLTWWTGPSSVAEGSETKANAYVYMSQNTVFGPRFGGTDTPVSGGSQTGGARSFASGVGGGTASTTVQNVVSGSLIEITAELDGGSLSADADWMGAVTISEETAGGSTTLFSGPVTATSGGLALPNGSYPVEQEPFVTASKFGVRSGAVTYRVTFARTGGSTYVDGATIRCTLKISPPV